MSFLKEFYGMDYQQAMLTLLDEDVSQLCSQTNAPKQKEKKPFALPPANENNRRVFAYLLKHRHLDRDVVTAFVRMGLIYEDQGYHNAVFANTARIRSNQTRPNPAKPYAATGLPICLQSGRTVP